ncbi:MAG TPA: TraB/GumN family protein, partial [Bacteroidota bacterium]|nr:TraB/GumN family protein [Bacteroidota bacterium]
KSILNFAFLPIFTLIFTNLNAISSDKGTQFFWEIRSNTATVYLLGSIHIGKESYYPMADVIENAFKKSDYLVGEINMENATIEDLMSKALFTGDSTLKSTLKDENYQFLKHFFDSVGIMSMMYDRFRPWYAIVMYQGLNISSQNDISNEYGVDVYFQNKARSDSIPILEIESVSEQIDYLIKMGNYADDIIEMERQNTEKDVSIETHNLMEAWEKGDEKALMKYFIDVDENFPKMQELMMQLIDERNVKMTKKIEEYLASDKTYFVVVGAGHTIGENSIINLLKKTNKYKIEKK